MFVTYPDVRHLSA